MPELNCSPIPIARSPHTALPARRSRSSATLRPTFHASPTPPRTSSPTRLASNDPWLTPAIDWDTTLKFRHRLWDLGLGVAEAMDTAQRGMGLNWAEAQELIRRAQAEAKTPAHDSLIAYGAGTDHLMPGPDVTIDDVIRAYEEQVGFVEGAGWPHVILMASRALRVAKAARSPDDYARVYGRILSPGEATGDPPLARRNVRPRPRRLLGLSRRTSAAMDVCLDVITAHADKVDGIKISLLSKEKEIAMRRRLPASVRMYTGDDFNYAELIAGDDAGPFRRAARHLRRHRTRRFGRRSRRSAVAATTSSSSCSSPRFRSADTSLRRPPASIKPAWCSSPISTGLQDHFAMIGGQQSTRSLQHLSELFRLADKARVLADPALAVDRMKRVLAVYGVV